MGMSDDKKRTERLPLSDLAPPVHLQEQRSGRRVVYLARHNGTGMELSAAFYQVRHICGQWAFAHLPFCAHCGGQVNLEPDLAAIVFPAGKEHPQPPSAVSGSFNNPLCPPAELSPRARQGFNTDPVVAAAAQSARALMEARGKAQVATPAAPELATNSPPVTAGKRVREDTTMGWMKK
jgi:hypothetical protein